MKDIAEKTLNVREATAGKIVVGLTGNIATGKSAVLRLAAEQGALTIEADAIVRELLDRDPDVQAVIFKTFGARMQQNDGRVDRAALGDLVFKNAAELDKLEQILHPNVSSQIVSLIQQCNAEVVLIEAIKLLEGNLWKLCQEIWVTNCSYERQLQRLQICRGLSQKAAVTRIEAQSPASEKVARADVVLDTNGLMIDTVRQFNGAWKALLAGRAGD